MIIYIRLKYIGGKMDIKEKADQIIEAMLWYKRKLAISEDININEIKEEDMKDVKILTEKNL
tara:strand:+ start:101 stop:286 length:186 start_codon:yes stop_codon:yes gene_type:complete